MDKNDELDLTYVDIVNTRTPKVVNISDFRKDLTKTKNISKEHATSQNRIGKLAQDANTNSLATNFKSLKENQKPLRRATLAIAGFATLAAVAYQPTMKALDYIHSQQYIQNQLTSIDTSSITANELKGKQEIFETLSQKDWKNLSVAEKRQLSSSICYLASSSDMIKQNAINQIEDYMVDALSFSDFEYHVNEEQNILYFSNGISSELTYDTLKYDFVENLHELSPELKEDLGDILYDLAQLENSDNTSLKSVNATSRAEKVSNLYSSYKELSTMMEKEKQTKGQELATKYKPYIDEER